MLKVKTVQMLEVDEFDKLVSSTYDRPYNIQQQDGCKQRGAVQVKVPGLACDYENDTLPEEVNGEEMGVSFKAWLARDSNWSAVGPGYHTSLIWERNFYPDVQMVVNDLHEKGLLPAGDYLINIDW